VAVFDTRRVARPPANNGNGRLPSVAAADRVAALLVSRAAADVEQDVEQDVELDVVEVRLGPVARVTAMFGAAWVVVWIAALGVAWVVASAAGVTNTFESFMRNIGFEGFVLDPRPVFLAIGLLGIAWILSIVVLAVLAAATYNAFASQFGGLRCVVKASAPRSVDDPAQDRDGAVAEPARVGGRDGETVDS
jgi:hypothetical protein